MNNITQELLNEFEHCQQRIEDISEMLHQKAKEVWEWENENLGKDHRFLHYRLKTDYADCVEFYPEDCVRFLVYDTWAYGGYEEKGLSISLYKLLGDDWRATALKEYQDALEQEKKKKKRQKKLLHKRGKNESVLNTNG